MDAQFDLVIVGAGIVGLATALEAGRNYPHLKVAVLEKEAGIAMHQTGHNSGVIHSGVYYQPGSLKARNCVAGSAAIIRFCQEQELPYDVCGKVIVATDQSELPALRRLLERGEANGISGLSIVMRERLRELEPHCAGIAALHVPGAGITNYGLIANRYAELFTASGGELFTGCAVLGIRREAETLVFHTTRGDISATYAINCAGLQSDRIRRMAGDREGPEIMPFRGEYYDIVPERQELVRNLIYPVPDPRFPFLGVHFTRMVMGGVEAGPNAVMAFKREGYRKTDFDFADTFSAMTFPGFWKMAARYWTSGVAEMYRSFSKRAFTRALKRLVPEVGMSDLKPGGSGVRAQALDRNGALLDDFSIVPSGRMIHVCNVPSPAATASLVIGEQLMRIADETFQLQPSARAQVRRAVSS